MDSKKLIPLNDIFDIQYGNQFDWNKMTQKNGGINFISRQKDNLGLFGQVEKYADIEPFSSGNITVTMGGSYLLSSYVQPKPFYTAQNIKVLSEKDGLKFSFREKIFYCMTISANRHRYTSHGREANSTFDNLLVPSPNEIPEYVSKVEIPAQPSQEAVSDKKLSLNDRDWKFFKLSYLFDIFTSKEENGVNREEGNVPFISSTQFNNGVSMYVDDDPTQKAGLITIARNGSVGSAFYQPIPFCASPDDIRVLNPKFEMNSCIAMFLLTIIEQEKFRYAYGRKFGTGRMKETQIKLPADSDGNPDWQFIEDYIKSLPYSSNL